MCIAKEIPISTTCKFFTLCVQEVNVCWKVVLGDWVLLSSWHVSVLKSLANLIPELYSLLLSFVEVSLHFCCLLQKQNVQHQCHGALCNRQRTPKRWKKSPKIFAEEKWSYIFYGLWQTLKTVFIGILFYKLKPHVDLFAADCTHRENIAHHLMGNDGALTTHKCHNLPITQVASKWYGKRDLSAQRLNCLLEAPWREGLTCSM